MAWTGHRPLVLDVFPLPGAALQPRAKQDWTLQSANQANKDCNYDRQFDSRAELDDIQAGA